MGPRISIVIPARNDAAALARTLDHLDDTGIARAAEVIVGASGDRDGTVNAVRDRAQTVWPNGSTRAALMNAGAAVARPETSSSSCMPTRCHRRTPWP